MRTTKSYLATPFIRFLKDSVKNPQNIQFYRKKYLFEKAFGKKDVISYTPYGFNIAITFRCNLRCPACQYLLRDRQVFDRAKDMPLEDFKWILEKFQKDIRVVVIQGGEPLLHPQFPEIVNLIRQKNLKLRMSSNGTLIPQRIEDLKRLNVTMNISLDGVDYQSFKKVRGGTLEQYQDIIEGIHLLRDAGIPFHLSFLVFEETLPQMKNILDFAREAKPTLIRFQSGNPHGSSAWTPLTVKSPQVKEFFKEVMDRNDYPFSIKMPVIFDPRSSLFHQQNCFQLWGQSYIGWNGDIAYCCQLAYDPKIGNIFQGYDFNSPPMVKFRKGMMEHHFPADCQYCPVRFWEKLFCEFNPKEKKWHVSPAYKKFLYED